MMRNIKIYCLTLLSLLIFGACENNNDIVLPQKGKLHINLVLDENTNITSRALPEGYDPKVISVKILNESGEVVESIDDFSSWKGGAIELLPAKYTIVASSYGWDGADAAFDAPYYSGSAQVTVSDATASSVSIKCKLANVKVTVIYDDTFKRNFLGASTVIASLLEDVQPLTINMGDNTASAYIPVGDFTARLAVVNKNGATYSQENKITNVKACDHYIFNYKVIEQGSAGITITADDSTKTYTYTFSVSSTPKTSLSVSGVNPWATFALVEAVATQAEGVTFDDTKMYVEYQKVGEENWTSVSALKSGDVYNAKITGLSASSSYKCRAAYRNGDEVYLSSERLFTTDVIQFLPNANMDSWYKDGKTWDAISASDFAAGNHFWDSSNPGTTTGAGAMVNVNPTQGSSSVVHTAGGMSAELKSCYASAFGIGKFAAASLYAGSFNSLVGTNGAKIDFGRPFTARPTQLKGWYRYNAGTIDYVGGNQPSGTVAKGDTDLCSAFVVLTTGTYTLDNTDLANTAKDFAKLLADPNDDFVVAYGALPDAQCVTTDWAQFAVDLTYKNLTKKPTHIIIVFSSSKYGDYFTGSTNSLLYIDDLELVYGSDPKTVGN